MEKKITTPLTKEKVKGLKAGDSVLISGTIYTARDAAHKRLVDLLDEGKELPLDLKDAIIYYVGPSPAKPGMALGSAGPTTSYRMDPYAPRLLDKGLKGMIGKGLRSKDVVDSLIKNNAVYFAAIGGAAALIGKSVEEAEMVAYEDLGAEAIRKLTVKDLPVVVVIDSEGNNLYKIGQQAYLDSLK
ncbi:Fe-S-containing hydro-lyase [Clostridium algidicarnis]|uniref:Fumarate hydratase subunit beta n=2 Tax=Clostridium algidicarnis TaxID=37659 RepID=A0A2S6FYM0_9CLOT|nr:Fe-S-containing hydro-lyase [Clostridium algidicarnis]MBB6698114.1 Fe-S-containing hydro-lyase [Clostridium algidicarnis]MBU3192532.1 Fe-S-containing hydro-lyase [Clostridium algidicarnis]MBU3196802.1 Fe-S-containing hydro-lyase [Clostridium algidicarnis]MBU3204285.1 Fe-S-containing hydro-lyase [Clostridium algidicarnis]MBU3207027.1 Fe-S-containing hydro-lyase [Clostridium algidicarnis]